MRYMVGIIKLWLPQIHLSLLTGNFGLGSGMDDDNSIIRREVTGLLITVYKSIIRREVT